MILHLVLNSLLIFLSLAIIIELFLLIFKVHNSRIKYLCRSFPFIKIPFDLLIFVFYGDSLFINLNPFSCDVYVYQILHKLFPSYISVNSTADEHLIIPQYFAAQLSHFWLNCLTVFTLTVAFAGIAYKIIQLAQSKKQIRHLLCSSVPSTKAISNAKLRNDLESLRTKIFVSADIEIPFATHPNYIVLPQTILKELSDEEFEAVIAHELQHLKWKDPLVKLIYSFICSLCWWIPTQWWLTRLIEDQEQASDASVEHYEMDRIALASAIAKVLKKVKQTPVNTTAACLLSSSKLTLASRLTHILNEHTFSLRNRYTVSYVFACLMSFLAFISLWMC